MVKKILYFVFAVLLGILVYLFTVVSTIGSYQAKLIKDASKNNNYDFFLKFTSYYNPNPVYESSEDDPFKLKMFEVYQEAAGDRASDLGYMIVIFDIDKERVNLDTAEDKSKIVFHAENKEGTPYKEQEVPLSLSSYDYYGTLFPFMAYGLNDGFNYVFGEKDDKGNVTKADVQKITKIELKNCEGEIFYTIEQEGGFNVGALTKEHILSFKTPGMTDKEYKNFNNPSSEIWKQALIMAGYILIAGGVAILLFRKPKMGHASASEFGGNMKTPYDKITKQVQEDRVNVQDAKAIAESDCKTETIEESKEETKE